MTCRFIERCPMFPLFQSRAALKVYQQVYCKGRFETCARYKLASSGTMPARSLLPDGGHIPQHWIDAADRTSNAADDTGDAADGAGNAENSTAGGD